MSVNPNRKHLCLNLNKESKWQRKSSRLISSSSSGTAGCVVKALSGGVAINSGKLQSGSLGIMGARGLRVVEASVILVPLAGHCQVSVLAIAEKAVDIILEENTHF